MIEFNQALTEPPPHLQILGNNLRQSPPNLGDLGGKIDDYVGVIHELPLL
ncbi:hypothetical protein IQ231_00055 [Cuspidothrix issatschenkoi LEGE 03284]|nr:hypothetical protein [Cuspidothrix issatschenkoi]MBE9230131.1 hypothetical protein [Cuspidothrix issatschenkoi LEGE 03284]